MAPPSNSKSMSHLPKDIWNAFSIANASDQEEPKKPRTSKPKVKTGCYTCKKRRIKCDESKPACVRCSNFGRTCEGYPSDEKPPKPEPAAPVARKLLAKAIQPLPSSPNASQTPLDCYAIADDQVFVNHFYNYTAVELSGGFDSTLGLATVTEAIEHCDSIRLLVVAAGALSISRRRNGQDEERSKRDPLHHYGLHKYGEALIGLQALVHDSMECMELALVSALLIFCVENLGGDLDRAIQQFLSVTPAILKQVCQNPASHYFSRPGAAGQQVGAISGSLLLHFMRFDRDIARLGGTQTPDSYEPTEYPGIFSALFENEQLEIPTEFKSLSDARIYLDDISYRACSLWTKIDYNPVNGMNVSSAERFSTLPRRILKWWQTILLQLPDPVVIERLADWQNTFSPMLAYSMTPDGDSMFVATATLQIEALVMEVLINWLYTESYIDPSGPQQAFPPTSKSPGMIDSVLSFSERLVAHPQYHKGFVFDTGIIPWLLLVLVLWPDRESKQRALEVMRSIVPRRDGIWDSKQMVEVCEHYLREIDEEELLSVFDPMLL